MPPPASKGQTEITAEVRTMSRGKAACAILKQIRRDIAEKNDIALTIAECTHQGDCPGTCPRCEAEVRILERALAEKKKKGMQTAVAGISAGLLAVSLSSCTPADKIGAQSLFDRIRDGLNPAEQLDGDVAPPDAPEPEDPENTAENDDGGEELVLDGDIAPYPDDWTAEGEDFALQGEPPVTDYCVDEEEEEPAYAGVLPAEDFELEGDVAVNVFEEDEGENP